MQDRYFAARLDRKSKKKLLASSVICAKKLSAICLSLTCALSPCMTAVNAQSVPSGGSQQTSHPVAVFPSAPVAGDKVVSSAATNILDFSKSSTLTIPGNLLNHGTIYALSTNPAITSGTISANNIYNYPGAIISSILPAGGIAGYANAVSGFSFTLNAVNNIVNAGIISSSGNLNLIAGNSIVNAMPPSTSAASPVMQAMSNLNMISPYIANAGNIASINNNINISSNIAQNILVNATGGTFSALNGSINVRDTLFNGKFDTAIIGGDWLSQSLNINSGSGNLQLDANQVLGSLNVTAHAAEMGVLTGNLNISSLNLTGDPTIYNAAGDIVINSSLQFPRQDLAIIAAGNVLSTANANGGGPIEIKTTGGNLLIASGAQLRIFGSSRPELPTGHNPSGDPPPPGINTFYADGFITKVLPDGTTYREPHQFSTASSSTILTIYGGNGKEGKIDLQNVALVSTVSSSGQDSGSIQLIAFAGGVNAPNTIFNTSASSVASKAGDIKVIANGSLSLGQINASGGLPGYQTTTIVSAQPYAFDVKWQPNLVALGTQNVVVQDGHILLGGFSEYSDFSAAPTFTKSSITLADVSSSGGDKTIALPNFFHSNLGGLIWIQTNGDILTGKLSASSVGSSSASEGGHIEITSAGHVLTKSIDLTSSPNFAGNSSLTVNLSGPGEFAVGTPSNHGVLGRVNADVVRISSQHGDINVPNPAVISNGHSTVDLIANNIKIGAGTLSADAYPGNYSAGTIYLRAANSLSISADLTANGAGSHSKGGSIYLNAPEILLAGSRSITALGSGTGSGGDIRAGGMSNFVMGGATNLLASGGADGGSGGRIRFDQYFAYRLAGSGSTLNLIANGNGAGSGGRVQISSADAITVSNTAINADASSLGSGAGGTARMQAASFVLNQGKIALHADGGQSGNGGNIYLKSTDANADLQLDNNFLVSANSGKTAGSGGTVSVSSGHDLNIKTSAVNAAVLGSQGNGGSITATAANGGLGGTLSLSGNLSVDGKDSGSGGYVSLNAAQIKFPDSTARLISANGGATGNGGSITIQQTDPKGTLDLGSISLSATGGSKGSSVGDGGSVKVEAAGNLNASPSKIQVQPLGLNGNGGTIVLAAGFISENSTSGQPPIPPPISTAGDKFLNLSGGTFNLDGSGDGKGGSLELVAPNITVSTPLKVSANGSRGNVYIDAQASKATMKLGGIVQALGGKTGGDGGTVVIKTPGTLDLSNLTASVSAQAGNGNGGSLTIGAAQSPLFPALTLTGKAILHADGSGSGSGGHIFVQAQDIPGLNVTASVNGGDSGTAGDINIVSSGTNTGAGATGAGTFKGLVQAQAHNFSTGIESGAIKITAQKGITLFPNSKLDVSAGTANSRAGLVQLGSVETTAGESINLGANTKLLARGVGGTINISGTTITASSLRMDTSMLTASTGQAGSITINASQKLAFSGAISSILAKGTDSGRGGVIAISANGITMKSGLSVDSSGGNGSTITISSKNNIVNTAGVVSLASNGTSSDGGNVTVSSINDISLGKTMINADGGANGSGGLVNLTSSNGAVLLTRGASSILSRGGTTDGTPGIIRITAKTNLELRNVTINASARAGDNQGGLIDLKAGGITTLGGTLATNGKGTGGGGRLRIQTGVLELDRHLSLFANGGQKGQGGDISLSASDTATPTIVVGAGNRQMSVSALAGQGNGGTFQISTTNKIKVMQAIDLSAAKDGNGGTLSLVSSQGKVDLVSGSLRVNGAGKGNGGNLTISGDTVAFGKGLVIEANAETNGNGGKVNVSAIGKNGSLTVGGLSGGLQISAKGGSEGGDGGSITLTAGKNLSIDTRFLDSSVAKNGNGGNDKFAVTSGSGNLFVRGTLDLHANGSGTRGGTVDIQGPHVDLSNMASINVAGAPRSGSSTPGKGGTVTINSTAADSDLQITDIDATGQGGGSIIVKSGHNLTINSQKFMGSGGTTTSKIDASGKDAPGKIIELDFGQAVGSTGNKLNVFGEVRNGSPDSGAGSTIIKAGAAGGEVIIHTTGVLTTQQGKTADVDPANPAITISSVGNLTVQNGGKISTPTISINSHANATLKGTGELSGLLSMTGTVVDGDGPNANASSITVTLPGKDISIGTMHGDQITIDSKSLNLLAKNEIVSTNDLHIDSEKITNNGSIKSTAGDIWIGSSSTTELGGNGTYETPIRPANAIHVNSKQLVFSDKLTFRTPQLKIGMDSLVQSVTIQPGSTVISTTDITLDAVTLTNNGTLRADANLQIQAKDSVTFSGTGTLSSGDNITLQGRNGQTSKTFTFQGSKQTFISDKAIDITINSGKIIVNGDSAIFSDNQTIGITTKTLTNVGAISANGHFVKINASTEALTLDVKGGGTLNGDVKLTNNYGGIKLDQSTVSGAISADANGACTISSNGGIPLQIQNINARSGDILIEKTGLTGVTGGILLRTGATLFASGNIVLNTGKVPLGGPYPFLDIRTPSLVTVSGPVAGIGTNIIASLNGTNKVEVSAGSPIIFGGGGVRVYAGSAVFSPISFNPASSGIHSMTSKLGVVWSKGVELNAISERSLSMPMHSKALIYANEDLKVIFGNKTVALSRGAIAFLQTSDEAITIFNLFDKHRSSVRIMVDSKQFDINPGEEAQAAFNCEMLMNDSIGTRRSEVIYKNGPDTIVRSEFSLLAALGQNDLSEMLGSPIGIKLRKNLIKLAACLGTTTQHHGPFTLKMKSFHKTPI